MDDMMQTENGGGDASVSQTKLMVNYIPEMMTQEIMYSVFSAAGKIESCKLIPNRGYGFVEYANGEDAEKARKSFDGMFMQGKSLKVSFALLNPESKASARRDTDSNLYVSNLPADMTLETLNAIFRPFGTITNSRISRGIAFVCFDNRSQAEEAITRLNGFTPSGGSGPVGVKFANKPGANRARPAPRQPVLAAAGPDRAVYNGNGFGGAAYGAAAPAGAGGLPYGVAGYPQDSPPPLLPSPGKALPFMNKGQQRFNPMAAANHAGHPSLSLFAAGANALLAAVPAAAQQTTVYVYNIGEEAEELSLWQLFGPYGAIDSIKVIRDTETKKNKGFAFVNMRDYEEAAASIRALNGYALNGQVLSVSFKTQKRK